MWSPGQALGLTNAHFARDLSDGVHLRDALELLHPREARETRDDPHRRSIHGDECGLLLPGEAEEVQAVHHLGDKERAHEMA